MAPNKLPPDATNGDVIQSIVRDLLFKQGKLSEFIDDHLEDRSIPVEGLARLLAIHSQNAARLGRLLRDKRALSEGTADAMSQAVEQALDELSVEWGIEL